METEACHRQPDKRGVKYTVPKSYVIYSNAFQTNTSILNCAWNWRSPAWMSVAFEESVLDISRSQAETNENAGGHATANQFLQFKCIHNLHIVY